MSVCVSLFPWRYSKYHSLLIFQALHTQLTRWGTVASGVCLFLPPAETVSWCTVGTQPRPAAERLPQVLCRGQHLQVHQCREWWEPSASRCFVCSCDCFPPPRPAAVCPPYFVLLLGQFCVLPLSRETPALPHWNILPFPQPPPP